MDGRQFLEAQQDLDKCCGNRAYHCRNQQAYDNCCHQRVPSTVIVFRHAFARTGYAHPALLHDRAAAVIIINRH